MTDVRVFFCIFNRGNNVRLIFTRDILRLNNSTWPLRYANYRPAHGIRTKDFHVTYVFGGFYIVLIEIIVYDPK